MGVLQLQLSTMLLDNVRELITFSGLDDTIKNQNVSVVGGLENKNVLVQRLLDIQNLRNGKISENIFVGRAGRERHPVVAVAIAVAPCSDRGGWLRAIRERALIRRKPAALPRSKGSLRQAQGRLFCATVRFQVKLDGGASG